MCIFSSPPATSWVSSSSCGTDGNLHTGRPKLESMETKLCASAAYLDTARGRDASEVRLVTDKISLQRTQPNLDRHRNSGLSSIYFLNSFSPASWKIPITPREALTHSFVFQRSHLNVCWEHAACTFWTHRPTLLSRGPSCPQIVSLLPGFFLPHIVKDLCCQIAFLMVACNVEAVLYL